MEDKTKIKYTSRKKGRSKISFDEEVVTKEFAKKLVSGERGSKPIKTVGPKIKSREGRMKKRPSSKEFVNENSENPIAPKKKRKDGLVENSIKESESKIEDSGKSKASEDNANGAKKESNRSLKRKKHAKLLEEKKLKIEVESQQKALNYLSKWRHSKSEWKFEKLRQVWLQQNLFDSSKVPDEFWDTAVQYFSGSKGQSRQHLLDEAIKFIEDEEKPSEENVDNAYQIKLKRARDIVQNLE